MTISSKSWHYRLYNLITSLRWALIADSKHVEDVPEDLWDVIAHGKRKNKTPKSLCKYFWVTVGSVVAIILLIPLELLMFLLLAILVYCIMTPVEASHSWYREWRPKEEKEPKEPGLVKTFFKAKKSKVCPLIYVDFGKQFEVTQLPSRDYE